MIRESTLKLRSLPHAVEAVMSSRGTAPTRRKLARCDKAVSGTADLPGSRNQTLSLNDVRAPTRVRTVDEPAIFLPELHALIDVRVLRMLRVFRISNSPRLNEHSNSGLLGAPR